MSAPLQPDEEEARRWAIEELSRRVYSEEKPWWEQLYDKFIDWLDDIGPNADTLPLHWVPLILLTVFLVAIIIVIALGGRMRRVRRAQTPQGPMWLEGDDRTTQEFWQAALQAANENNFTLAIIEGFRGIVSHLEEHDQVETHHGMTALEVAGLIAMSFPTQEALIHRTATLFNHCLYGELSATQTDYHHILTLAQAINAAPDKVLTSR